MRPGLINQPRAHWVRAINAWPNWTEDPGAHGDPGAALQARVVSALAAELAMLEIGDRLRVVTSFGDGAMASAVYRVGTDPTAQPSSLGAVLGLDAWAASPQPLPAIGGDLVTRVTPVDRTTGQPVSMAGVAELHFPLVTGATVWTAMAEQLVYNRLPIAVVVEVERRHAPSRAEFALQQGLLMRAATRAGRRGGSSPLGDRQVVPGDVVVSVGIVGDTNGFASIWAAHTTLGVRSSADRSVGRVDLGTRRVDANAAARFLPVPVLPPYSTIPVPRHAPRASAATRVLPVASTVTVALTDTSSPIGWDPVSVNKHLLILGESGAGKSLTTMSLLREMWERFGVAWLVIDPIKYEHARLRVLERPRPAGLSTEVPVRHLQLGHVPVNPMVVPEGVDRLAFASAMAQAFSSVTNLGEAFPLGEQIVRAAFNDLYSGAVVRAGHGPTLADLEAALMAASHQDGMTGETARNVRTSLLGRLRSITSGVAGNAFAGGPRAGIDWAKLSLFPTVITFPLGMSEQDKAVIYALLVSSHWSWRLANPTNGRHIMALEEIHQIYGRNNPISAQMLDTLLATMRDSGQGYLAVTQNPHQLGDLTQRSFQNMVVHRISQHTGLTALDVLGAARPEVAGLDNGEVLAVLGTPHGIRGRVLDRSGGAGERDAMIPLDSHRAEDFTTAGPVVRGWCSACPRPCTGRSWLQFTRSAAAAADQSLANGERLQEAVDAAVNDVLSRSAGTLLNSAGLYCASARAVTVALGVRGASDSHTRTACQLVRNSITIRSDPAYGNGN